jgi:hypothetical protein
MTKFKVALSVLAIAAAFVSTQAAAAKGGVDDPARQAFVQSGTCNVPAGTSCNVNISVPADSMLVIETISVRGQGAAGTRLIAGLTHRFGAGGEVYVPAAFVGTFSGIDISVGTQLVRLYAEPGSTVQAFGGLTGGVTGIFSVSISGHLVSCGAGDGCPTP